MAFYSENNEIFDCKDFTYFDEGMCSKVYRSGDVLFKCYNIDCNHRLRLQKKMFMIIKNLNAPNLVKLYDFFYMFNSAVLKLLCIDAYTMELVNDDKIKLIDCDRKFLIEILKELEETLNILCDNKVVLCDVHYKNIIINNNGITIIDPDQFYFSKFSSKREIYKLNKSEILRCLNNILISELMENDNCYVVSLITSHYNSSLIRDVISSLNGNTFRESIVKKKK